MCSISGCTRPVYRKGWCGAHYGRWWRHGDPLAGGPMREPKVGCLVPGCDGAHDGLGYCKKHRARFKRFGDPLKLLTRERGTGTVTPEGYVRVPRFGVGRSKRQRVFAHRLAMEHRLGRALRPDEDVHHINGDKADNRDENLELWSTSHPKGQRVADLVAWARDILARYEGELDAHVPRSSPEGGSRG